MNKIPIHLDVNGVPYDLLVDPGRSLVDVLRDDLQLTGTKRSCNEGECASCAVHLDGTVVNSCLVLARGWPATARSTRSSRRSPTASRRSAATARRA